MIEVLTDVPEGVIGIRVSGRLTGEELQTIKPRIADQMKSGREIRIVEVIDDYDGFGPGGLMEDLKLGIGSVWPNHSAFKRVAVVTNTEWITHTLHALAWIVPGEMAVFRLDELEAAKRWAAG
ncbi:MAG: STAS/SEC14 domain-containing protein [Mycobacterium sp.]